MKVEFLIFSKRVAKGDESFDLSALFSICKKTGVQVENIAIKNEYDFELVEKAIKNDALIVFCDKKNIDLYEINLSYKFSSERQVVFDDCVLLNSGTNVLFVPISKKCLDNVERFLIDLNANTNTSIFRLFGKSASFVKKVLNENNISLDKIDIYENNLLCDIFIHEDKSVFGISDLQQKIGMLFADNIYSESEKTLRDTAVELLKLNSYKISFIEPFTCGNLAKMFLGEKDCDVVYESVVPINERSLIKHSMMTGADYQSYGSFGLETNNFMANAFLADKGADVGIIITAEKGSEGYNMLMTIVTRNFKTTIKTTYKGNKRECVDFATNWAIFNLVKKLRKKDFEIV